MQRYLKPSLLLIDEVGYLPVDKLGADLLSARRRQTGKAKVATKAQFATVRVSAAIPGREGAIEIDFNYRTAINLARNLSCRFGLSRRNFGALSKVS